MLLDIFDQDESVRGDGKIEEAVTFEIRKSIMAKRIGAHVECQQTNRGTDQNGSWQITY